MSSQPKHWHIPYDQLKSGATVWLRLNSKWREVKLLDDGTDVKVNGTYTRGYLAEWWTEERIRFSATVYPVAGHVSLIRPDGV